jgi:hypothetical protein
MIRAKIRIREPVAVFPPVKSVLVGKYRYVWIADIMGKITLGVWFIVRYKVRSLWFLARSGAGLNELSAPM